jgi:hypothetical protein
VVIIIASLIIVQEMVAVVKVIGTATVLPLVRGTMSCFIRCWRIGVWMAESEYRTLVCLVLCVLCLIEIYM